MHSSIPPSVHEADTAPMIPVEPTAMLARLVDEMSDHAIALPPSLHALLPAAEACLNEHWSKYQAEDTTPEPSEELVNEAFDLVARKVAS